MLTQFSFGEGSEPIKRLRLRKDREILDRDTLNFNADMAKDSDELSVEFINEFTRNIIRSKVNFREQKIKDKLIELGWIPPLNITNILA